MRIVVDLDGTLCNNTWGDYDIAEPFVERIRLFREFIKKHDAYVLVSTSRGGTTGIDWRPTTERQLKEWGVPYDELHINQKPEYDLWIDDKAVSSGLLDSLLGRKL